jgi:hypothetical protein
MATGISSSYSETMQRTESKLRVAVLDFKAESVDRVAANAISDMLRADMVNDGRFIVVERNQVDTILKEQGFQQTGCTDNSCAVEMGKLISANKMVLGELSKVNETMYVTIRIVDVAKGASEHAEKGSIRKDEQIDVVVSRIAEKLMDRMAGKKERSINIGPILVGNAPSGVMLEYTMFIPSNSDIVDYYESYQGIGLGYVYPMHMYLSAIGRVSYVMSKNEDYSAYMSFNSYQVGARLGAPLFGFMYPYVGLAVKGTWIYEKGEAESANFMGYGIDGAAGIAFQIMNFSMYGEFSMGYGKVFDENGTDLSSKAFCIGAMYKLF